MPMKRFSNQQLQAYLDESLSTDTMAEIEAALRQNEALRDQLVIVAGMREAGVHGLGEIWRRNRLSCPTREQLGSLLLGAIEPELDAYIRFHIEEVGCRVCRANLEDLDSQRSAQQEEASATASRRRRYFQTSVGHLGSRPSK